MKIEARILVSTCHQGLCASAILRGRAFDAIVLATGCHELCELLESRGYIYELRYSIGDCRCNLPEPPKSPELLEDVVLFLTRLAGAMRDLKLINSS